MLRIDKIKLAIEKGYTYNPETGKIYGVRGKEIIAKTVSGYLKICLRFNNKNYDLLCHHIAWYIVYKEVVERIDHINKDKSDNRICNLRKITNQQNAFNTNAKGTYFDKKRNKYQSLISLNGKTIHLGRFDHEIDARKAYLEAKLKYHKI